MLTLVGSRPRDRESANDVARLLGTARGQVETVDLADLIARVRTARPDLVIVCDAAGDAELARLVASLAGTAGAGYFILAAPTIDPDVYRILVRSGRADWVRSTHLAEDLEDVLERLAVPATQRSASGRIVSFVPVAGGVGNTTMTMETAIHAALRKGPRKARICVLDLNVQYSALPDHFDVQPRFDVASVVDDPSRLDEHLLALLVSPHPSGVDVICAPPSTIDPARLSGDAVFALLDAVVQRYDVVHVDLTPLWFPWVETLLAGSDAVVVTGAFDVPSVKRIAAVLKQIEGQSDKPRAVAVVVNRFEHRLFGASLKRSDVEQSLVGRAVFMPPLDMDGALEAVNTGASLVQSGRSRKLVHEIGRLSDWIAGPGESAATRKIWPFKVIGG